MRPPEAPPSPENQDAWRSYALHYLRDQLRADAPAVLGDAHLFPASPLDGEGAVFVFPFSARHGSALDHDYYVVVGRTEPNYYPAYGLTPQEAFELHLGTRFMLVLGVAQRPPAPEDDFDMNRDARLIVDRVAPGVPIEDLALVASFDVEGLLHAVLKCRIKDTDAYIMAASAPMGFCTRTDLPPQVAYRLHIGHALRREPKPADDDA